MHLREVENPPWEVVNNGDLQCMEEVGLREVTHNTGNKSRQVESLVKMAQREFGIDCLGVVITEHSTVVVILLAAVFQVRRDKISKFVLWTFPRKSDMPLKMM